MKPNSGDFDQQTSPTNSSKRERKVNLGKEGTGNREHEVR